MGRAAAVFAARDVPRWDDETDVAVVGFGAAGACAAVEAAGVAADVLVLERASGGGGTSSLSSGQIYFINTPEMVGRYAPLLRQCRFRALADATFFGRLAGRHAATAAAL